MVARERRVAEEAGRAREEYGAKENFLAGEVSMWPTTYALLWNCAVIKKSVLYVWILQTKNLLHIDRLVQPPSQMDMEFLISFVIN